MRIRKFINFPRVTHLVREGVRVWASSICYQSSFPPGKTVWKKKGWSRWLLTFPLNRGTLGEKFWVANGTGFSLGLEKGLKLRDPVQNTLVTFPFCCIPNTHVLPACCRGCNILAEAAAYDLSSPSRSAWKTRKILCERFFSLKASLREPAIFKEKVRLLKANTQWVYFSPMWCNHHHQHHHIFF